MCWAFSVGRYHFDRAVESPIAQIPGLSRVHPEVMSEERDLPVHWPCIHTPVNRSVVRDGVDGILAPGAGMLGQALVQLFDAPELAKSMGEHGRRRVADEFTWASSVSSLEALINAL